jgi:N-acetylglucosaminyldiphosphoundecaprenol N-acetyl-beta-D-mannosaminyltransferase
VAVDPAAVAVDSASAGSDRLDILNVAIDTMRRSEVERRIVVQLAEHDASLLHIATANPEYVVAARNYQPFSEALSRADLVVPDGVGIVLAARLLHEATLDRVTGVDLVRYCLTTDETPTPRTFLLGNPESIAELQGRHPTRIVGRWGGGSPDPEHDLETLERIRERGANVVLVGYGAPGQVLWIERNRDALAEAGIRVAIGVGGALDFAAGTVDRAPQVVRRLGLEWAYRLTREPWRWRRQLALPRFAALVLRERLARSEPGKG